LILCDGAPYVQVTPSQTNSVVGVKIAEAIEPLFQDLWTQYRFCHYNLSRVANFS